MTNAFPLKIRFLTFSLFISLVVGGFIFFLSYQNLYAYQDIKISMLPLPASLLPVGFVSLFTLMGVSGYLLYVSDSPYKEMPLKLYALQFAVGLLWSVFFFNLRVRMVAFLWLILLAALAVAMIISFHQINKLAAYLQIPYFLWIVFLGYLNHAVFF